MCHVLLNDVHFRWFYICLFIRMSYVVCRMSYIYNVLDVCLFVRWLGSLWARRGAQNPVRAGPGDSALTRHSPPSCFSLTVARALSCVILNCYCFPLDKKQFDTICVLSKWCWLQSLCGGAEMICYGWFATDLRKPTCTHQASPNKFPENQRIPPLE